MERLCDAIFRQFRSQSELLMEMTGGTGGGCKAGWVIDYERIKLFILIKLFSFR